MLECPQQYFVWDWWALIRVSSDPTQETGPEVGNGCSFAHRHSFVRLQHSPKEVDSISVPGTSISVFNRSDGNLSSTLLCSLPALSCYPISLIHLCSSQHMKNPHLQTLPECVHWNPLLIYQILLQCCHHPGKWRSIPITNIWVLPSTNLSLSLHGWNKTLL